MKPQAVSRDSEVRESSAADHYPDPAQFLSARRLGWGEGFHPPRKRSEAETQSSAARSPGPHHRRADRDRDR
jgi:hypothetical protein